MNFNCLGYPLKFVQKNICKDNSEHLHSLIYKFYSPHTKLNYILRAEYHTYDVYVIKFYVQSHHSKRRYSTITNKGDFCNIIISCCSLVPMLLSSTPKASFAFMGGRSILNKRVEILENNQRFRIYSEIAALKFGQVTFEHIEYPKMSSYLLLNRNCDNLSEKEDNIKSMFIETYNDMLDLDN